MNWLFRRLVRLQSRLDCHQPFGKRVGAVLAVEPLEGVDVGGCDGGLEVGEFIPGPGVVRLAVLSGRDVEVLLFLGRDEV